MAQVYDLLVSAVQPRPIAFVSTLSPDGVANLAPFSFYTAGGVNPPSLVLSINQSGHGDKDSLKNIEASGEFVVNGLTRAMAEGMNQTSAAYPAEESEWPRGGFSVVPSDLVKPPRVAESPVQMECKLFQVIRHGNGPGAACYVIGEVIRIHLLGNDLSAYQPISRLGGAHYLDLATLERFSMERPQ